MGRTDGNKIAVFPKGAFSKGDLIDVKIHDTTANTLLGRRALEGHGLRKDPLHIVPSYAWPSTLETIRKH